MSALRPTRLIRLILARLGAILLVLALLLPGQSLQAAPLLAHAHPAHNRPALLPLGPADPAVNQRPVAHDDNLVAFANEGYQELYVLDNDTDQDIASAGDRITVADVGFSQHGSTGNDFFSIPYEPLNGFSGIDHFKYLLTDRHGLTATANVTVTVVAASGTTSDRFAIYAGPYESSRWTINPFGGTDGSNASNGQCDGSAGLSVEDALLATPFEHYNAFDNGLTVWVNNTQVTAALPMAVTRHSLISGPTNAGNLRVYLKYYGLSNSDTLRTLVSFVNVTASTIPVTVTLATNLGTDAYTVIPGSSDGNTSFNIADRWIVTGDSLTNPGEIVDTHVLYGPGSGLITPNLAQTTVFGCGDIQAKTSFTDTHGLRSRFQFSVPGTSTRSLLFFNQAHTTNVAALADAAVFNSEPVDMLQGLTNTDLNQIVNWKLLPVSRLFLPLLRR